MERAAAGIGKGFADGAVGCQTEPLQHGLAA
jgi:hypothetical protein